MRHFLKILKWLAVGFLTLLLLLAGASYLLYAGADMKQPDLHLSDLPELPLSITDSLRSYGDNSLLLNRQGLWELYVKGAPFERGVAIGRLSEDLLYYQEKVFVDEIKKIIPSEKYLNFLRYFLVIFNRNLGKQVPEENREEIYGISLSCTDEFNAIGTPYERQLNYHAAHDIGHMMQSYMLVGCSSFGAWGGASADSTLILGRNFDFYVGDDFASNKVVAFYQPDKGYRFASVGWIGMTGVLSGMNEAGLTVTINASQAAIPTGSATPISLLARMILQYAATIDEAYEIAGARKTFVAESLLIGSAKEGKAAIIEKSPDAIGMYRSSSERIVCTNHYQSDLFGDDPKNRENIRTTDSDYRFRRMNELLDRAGKVNPEKAAAILRDTLGLQDKPIGLTNEKSINQFIAHHSVIFKPQELKMWVSTAPWQLGEFVLYDLEEIFREMERAEIEESAVKSDSMIAPGNGLTSGTYGRVQDYRRLKEEIARAMKKAICIGESLRNADFSLNTLGRRIHEKWSEPVLLSTYASTEMQASFAECEHRQGGHLQPELIITEFLDDDGNPVAEGIPCACGRNSVRLSAIVGRKGQLIKFKGTTLYPPALYDILDNLPQIRDYIIDVYTNNPGTDEIVVRVGCEHPSEKFEKELKDLFRSRVRVAHAIQFASPEYIAQLKYPETSRKAVKFVDLR